MSRSQQTFKQGDVIKLIKAAIKAGVRVGRIEIDKAGKIAIVVAKADDTAEGQKQVKSEWDEILS